MGECRPIKLSAADNDDDDDDDVEGEKEDIVGVHVCQLSRSDD